MTRLRVVAVLAALVAAVLAAAACGDQGPSADALARACATSTPSGRPSP